MVDLLAFAPHPDDAEIGVGGIVARLAAMGRRVAIVDLTRGERSSNGTVAERMAEAGAAARILGAMRENLGLPDGGLEPGGETAARMAAAIRRLRPRLVLAPYWEDRHPDHRAAGLAAWEAVRLAGHTAFQPDPPHTPQLLGYYFIHGAAQPTVIVDVSESYGAKEAALLAHRSQFVRDPGRVATALNDGGFLEAIRARDARWGTAIGAGYGEGLLFREPAPRDLLGLS